MQKTQRLTIKNTIGTVFADILPSVGGSIGSFYKIDSTGQRHDYMRPAPLTDDFTVLDVSSFPLTPFSNRIDHGKFVFNGNTYHVAPNFRDEPHPNHGDGWTNQWKVINQTDGSITLELIVPSMLETPYTYRAQQTYSLDGDTLTVEMLIENLGLVSLPFGLGHHPYFVRDENTILETHVTHTWHSENMIPVKRIAVPPEWSFQDGLALNKETLGEPQLGFSGNDHIDHCFGGWHGVANIRWTKLGKELQITADDTFQHFVVYVPTQDFFCAEPVSHATDAFNLAAKSETDTGIFVLAPNETKIAEMNFTIVS